MSRSNKPELAYSSILFVTLKAAWPRAIELLVYTWSSANVCFVCGIGGTTRKGRVLRGCILVGRI
jgi:hypothetical protein